MEIVEAELTTWPPPYQLRISHKAKRVHLRILPHLGLEIIVPVRQQKYLLIEQLLAEYKPWILKHLKPLVKPIVTAAPELELRALNQHWQISYKPTTIKQIRHKISICGTSQTLQLYGAVQDPIITNNWLKKWLKIQAELHLIPWLQRLSILHQLPYNNITIRGQQTLWGSCTSAKNINLNYKLLFLPPEYVEHIMLHELCHTKHLNHSRRFWGLLTSLDPLCELHDRAIRKGDNLIPQWVNFHS